MKDLIKYIAQALVDNPDQVSVEEVEGNQTSVLWNERFVPEHEPSVPALWARPPAARVLAKYLIAGDLG